MRRESHQSLELPDRVRNVSLNRNMTVVLSPRANSFSRQWNEHIGRMLEARMNSTTSHLESRIGAFEAEVKVLRGELKGEPIAESSWLQTWPTHITRS